MAHTVDKICFEDDRLMMVRLKGKPVDVVIVQVYMPMADYKDEEVDAVYERIEELLDKETKGMVTEDWSAVAGEVKEDGGRYGHDCRMPYFDSASVQKLAIAVNTTDPFNHSDSTQPILACFCPNTR